MNGESKNGIVTVATAKALILGDSGVGKSGLLHRLQGDAFTPTASTHGINVVALADAEEANRRIELWDLAGQPDYNVIHQLFIGGTHVAVILFDESAFDPLGSIEMWTSFLNQHCPDLHAKLLVSARIDRATPRFTEEECQKLASRYGFEHFTRTSAKTNSGIDELRGTLLQTINWDRIPWTSMPSRWWAVHEFVDHAKQERRTLLSLDDMHARLSGQHLELEELRTIVTLLHSKGDVFVLNPRPNETFVLLQPEVLNSYGASIVLAARTNVSEPGELSEADILRADFDLRGIDRLPSADERLLLDSVVTLLAETGACHRSNGKLIFDRFVSSQVKTRAKLKCFLSHNSADKPIAEQIGRQLLNSGVDVWLDKWEILAGESLTSRIEEGIADANSFIILMSPHSMKAKWVKEELRIALQKRLEDQSFALIPILLQDCEIPGFLKDYIYVDWRDDNIAGFEFLLRSLRRTKSKPSLEKGG